MQVLVKGFRYDSSRSVKTSWVCQINIDGSIPKDNQQIKTNQTGYLKFIKLV